MDLTVRASNRYGRQPGDRDLARVLCRLLRQPLGQPLDCPARAAVHWRGDLPRAASSRADTHWIVGAFIALAPFLVTGVVNLVPLVSINPTYVAVICLGLVAGAAAHCLGLLEPSPRR